MENKSYLIEGVDCGSCSVKIEDALMKVEGINKASFNFMAKKLDVIYDSSLNDLDKIVKDTLTKIDSAYEIVEEKKEIDNNVSYFNWDLFKIIISLILFAIGILVKMSSELELAIFLIAYAIIGYEVVLRAFKNIVKGQIFDENFLMMIATFGAFAIGEYPEGIAVMLFYQIGEYFQEHAIQRSQKSISSLLEIKPEFANIKVNNELVKVNPEIVNVDDIIVIKPGERFPLDCVVVSGNSTIDASALTGESLPIDISTDSNVISGCINLTSVIEARVTKVFQDSMVNKILDLVQNATSQKADTEKFITKFARYYTPVVVFVALFIATILPLVLNEPFEPWIYKALVFLVISCPCALVISVPLGYFAGIGLASKNGILIKGSNYLEHLSIINTVVFDKTGTLTKGVFKITDIKANNVSNEKLLEYAAYAESYSNHPIAVSIVKEFNQNIDQSRLSEYTEIAGHGISVKLDNDLVLIGNDKLMKSNNINYVTEQLPGTVIHVCVNNEYYGYLLVADEIKDDALECIEGLNKIGVKKTVMLTGDNRIIGDFVKNKLKLSDGYYELLPDQKVEKVLELKKDQATNLAFVGDGINDAPVLASSDVGIAMGGLGSDAAIEAADIVIMNDEPSKIVDGIIISKKTKKIVTQNIVISLAVKFIVLGLGFFSIASMWFAIFADVGVSIIAILNAMRLLYIKKIS